MYRYYAFSKSIKSDIRLFGFPVVSDATTPDISITKDSQHYSPSVAAITEVHAIRDSYGNINCTFPNNASYTISSGKNIFIRSPEDIDPNLEELPIHGFVMAALLHQANLFVLHGCAVEVNHKAILIVGGKSFGKSTLAASLVAQGHRLISDDIVAIGFDGIKPYALPGTPAVKIWLDALEKSRLKFVTSRKIYSKSKKLIGVLESNKFCKEPKKISQLILLGGSNRDTEIVSITNGSEKMLSVIKYHYLSRHKQLFGKDENRFLFLKAKQLSDQLEFYRLSRPLSSDTIRESCRLVEKLASKKARTL